MTKRRLKEVFVCLCGVRRKQTWLSPVIRSHHDRSQNRKSESFAFFVRSPLMDTR